MVIPPLPDPSEPRPDVQRRVAELEGLVARYRTIIDMLVEGVVLRDAEGRLLAHNPSAERLMGFPLGPVLGSRDLGGIEFVGEDGQPLAPEDLPSFRTLQTGEAFRGIILGVVEAAGIRWLETNTEPLWEPGRPEPVGTVVSFWDITARKDLEDRLRRESTHDALTGLPNRRALGFRLQRALAGAARFGTPLALAFCDLDRFKQINDECGHAAGDEVLRIFAASILANLRQVDFAARVGGDEFCVLFEGTPARQAAASLERARQEFAARSAAHGTPATATFGLADWRPGMDAGALMGAADAVLLRAKSEGRDRVGRQNFPEVLT